MTHSRDGAQRVNAEAIPDALARSAMLANVDAKGFTTR
jgi:hypothetical protein